jgi:hypothetical protein
VFDELSAQQRIFIYEKTNFIGMLRSTTGSLAAFDFEDSLSPPAVPNCLNSIRFTVFAPDVRMWQGAVWSRMGFLGKYSC